MRPQNVRQNPERGAVLIFILIGMAIITAAAVGSITLQRDRRYSMDAEDMASEHFYDSVLSARSMTFRRTVTANRSTQTLNDLYAQNVAPVWYLKDMQRRGLDIASGRLYMNPTKSMRSDYMLKRTRKHIAMDLFVPSAENNLQVMDMRNGEASTDLNEFSREPRRR